MQYRITELMLAEIDRQAEDLLSVRADLQALTAGTQLLLLDVVLCLSKTAADNDEHDNVLLRARRALTAIDTLADKQRLHLTEPPPEFARPTCHCCLQPEQRSFTDNGILR